MPNMTNHGYYISFKRTDEELKVENIAKENKELKSQLSDLQSKFKELSDKIDKSDESTE